MALSYRPSPDALLNPCADPIFKILFTTDSDDSRGALTAFLSDILEKPVTDVVLQPNELSGECLDDKQSEFDINCKLDGKIVNIEIQGRNEYSDYGKRAEYHVAHLLNHYTPKGTKWQDLPLVFQISVLNFIYDKKQQNCINWYTMRSEEGGIISNTMNVIFIELPKIKRLPDDISKLTKAEMWGKFFLYGSDLNRKEYVRELSDHNKGIKMAVTVLDNVSRDEMNWYHESRYWMHVSDMKSAESHAIEKGLAEGLEKGLAEGLEKGLAEGLEKGKAEGIQQANFENARKMLSHGIDCQTIFEVTGISEELLKEDKQISL